MIRNFLRLLIALLVVVVIRYAVAAIQQALGRSLGRGSGGPQPSPAAGNVELYKDPVCGTFVPETSGFSRIEGGRRLHFCSAACRDKYQAA
ncbi:MAG: YHS domain-containing protein [Acidobacteria bacterium]|nr:YHS domain-containing protein [Acidobacteriota bacterium]